MPFLLRKRKGGNDETPELCACVITDDTLGDVRYEEHLCTEHAALEHEILQAVKEAETDKELIEAFETGREQWQQELDEQMDQRMEAAQTMDERKCIILEETAFDEWTEKREDFLELIYEDKPEIVAEVMLQIIRGRVFGLCEGEE